MTFEMLVSSVDTDPKELAAKMNIQSDAVIVDQCAENGSFEFEHNGSRIKVIKQDKRGVGLSRNTAFDDSDADIVLFADEDIVYEPGYKEKIIKAFEEYKEYGVIAFNVLVDERRFTYFNENIHRVRWYNYGRYPAYALAVRREEISKHNIRYSELFGGGAKYSNGEDSLFLHDCLKRRIKILAHTDVLGAETYRESTWFKGYTDKFFFDRGVLYHFLYGKASAVFGARFLLANRSKMLKERSFFNAFGLILKGIKEGKTI